MFEYDPFQKKAIQLIDAEHSLLVAAPTGAGKTCIAEYAINQAMTQGKHAIYTAPIKALSNQKFRDFRARYGDENVGIVTGDVTINSHAPLLIMTTEIYRNRLFEESAQLEHVSWIVYDEIHYLDDAERGTVWEESIMFSPPHVKFICLSATVPNIEELADWMNTVHDRNVAVIIENNRPVPLHNSFQAQGKVLPSFKKLRIDGYQNHLDWGKFKRQKRRQPRGRNKKHGRYKHYDPFPRLHPNRIDSLVKYIKENDGLPCIFFAFARKRTEYLANELTQFSFLTKEERKEVLSLFDDLCAQYEVADEPSIQALYTLVGKGIAYHHAGMLPTVKEVVERLFTSRLIKVIFTTETFALGINMPAKTVVFDELRKFHGTHFGPLRTRDYYQMAGRAGRRGMDDQGFVYARVNPKMISFREVEEMIKGEPEPVMSQFNAAYATLLNLYSKHQERLFEIYPLSFHYYQASNRGRERALKALRRKVELLKHARYIQDNELTAKGEFAACMYGYELPLAEMLDDGLFDEVSETELTMLLIALVYEPRKGVEPPKFDKHIKHLKYCTKPYKREIISWEMQFKIFPETKPPFFDMAPAMRAWAEGADFQDVQDYTEADEGEIVRYFRMTIQLLRLIREAPIVPRALKAKCAKAIALINRDEIDAEKQLRV